MKISYNWLREHVSINLAPEEIAEILTNTGLEVESFEKIETIPGGLAGVVVGEVITCHKHPDADKLSVTTVNVGGERLLPIVCGAPNVQAGQKVLVATTGTTLHTIDGKSFEIKKAKIRGEVSEGMICAEDELGLGESHEGIMVLPPETATGTPAKEYFGITDDYVFEIGLTPNRNDAMSHVGVARDLIAALNHMHPHEAPRQLITACTDSFVVENENLDIEIQVEDPEACPRYSGVTMTNVKVRPSPDWLKNYLLAIGLRPINNLVDISNFVLHETGHPTHFFDADKIAGKKVIVKKLPAGTEFTTLDAIEHTLSENDLMICDANGGMCMAGIYGGIDSGVTEQTRNIFIESAFFDPKTIRKTARLHAMNTDSSFRFERGVDPNATLYVLRRAALLIKELAGGQVSSQVKDFYPRPVKPLHIPVMYKNIDRLIGISINHDRLRDILIFLGMEIISHDPAGFTVEVPTYRSEVTRQADIIEEVLRIYGYNNIPFPGQLRASLSSVPHPDREYIQELTGNFLSDNGFIEIINNSLTRTAYSAQFDFINEASVVKINNPLSNDLGVMRQTLLLSGMESIIYNLNHKNQNLKFYEFGKIYHQNPQTQSKDVIKKYSEQMHLALFITGQAQPENWHAQQQPVDVYLLRSFVEGILRRLNVSPDSLAATSASATYFETGLQLESYGRPVVEFGEIKRSVLQHFDIRQPVFYANLDWELILGLHKNNKINYQPVSKFPEVRRDLALLIDENVTFAELRKIALDTERNILQHVGLFDVYEGEKIPEGKKSYALSFILQDNHRTLTDRIIDKTMTRIADALKQKTGAELRK
jgi:phenylalanyl-tRNA synthetase beta chain